VLAINLKRVEATASRKVICQICGRAFLPQNGAIGDNVRPSLAEFIKSQRPNWDPHQFICFGDLGAFRRDYVKHTLECEIGELTSLDQEVIESLREHEVLSENIEKSEYVGLEKVGNVMCHHCRFIQEDFDWDIWIDAGKQPLVHKVVPDLRKQLEDGSRKMQDAQVSFVVTISDWNVAPKFTAADFTFTPPANSQKVDSFIPEEPPHPLLGQPAPTFATTQLPRRRWRQHTINSDLSTC